MTQMFQASPGYVRNVGKKRAAISLEYQENGQRISSEYIVGI